MPYAQMHSATKSRISAAEVRAAVAAAVQLILQFAHHAEARVVEYDDFERRVALADRAELAHAHLKRAVAAHGNDLPPRLRDRGAEPCRQR